MKKFKDIFKKKPTEAKRNRPSEPTELRAPAAEQEQRIIREQVSETLYRKGDKIGNYEVLDILGKGGFGVVYQVRHQLNDTVVALKTFRDEFLADSAARDMFRKEIQVWVDIGRHPFILSAKWVEEISGRFFVNMEYIAPDDCGRVNLHDHLTHSEAALEIGQAFKWCIQFCHGMEHANSHGVKCHRDIKPANILITKDGNLKITDFGLAVAAEASLRNLGGSIVFSDRKRPGLSLMQTGEQSICGTPGYMAPEVFQGKGADIRSDIYSFGLILWQMATGSSHPPFAPPYKGDLDSYVKEIHELQMHSPVPPVKSLLWPMIERCLQIEPSKRYESYAELREDLEKVLEDFIGISWYEFSDEKDDCSFWNNKGLSSSQLGCHEEALSCFDKAIALNQKSANPLINKGSVLETLHRFEESIACLEKALEIDPHNVQALNNMGITLDRLGRLSEAIAFYDKALEIKPTLNSALMNKAILLGMLDRHEEGIDCFDKALENDPLDSVLWRNKALALNVLGRHEEEIACFKKAIEIDPQNADAWYDMGVTFGSLGYAKEALISYEKALEINPRFIDALANKATIEHQSGDLRAAVSTYRKYLEVASDIPEERETVMKVRAFLGKLQSG